MRRISRIVGLSALIMRVNFGLASGKKSDGAYERHIELTRSTSSVPHLKFGLLAQAGRQRVAPRDNSALLVLAAILLVVPPVVPCACRRKTSRGAWRDESDDARRQIRCICEPMQLERIEL